MDNITLATLGVAVVAILAVTFVLDPFDIMSAAPNSPGDQTGQGVQTGQAGSNDVKTPTESDTRDSISGASTTSTHTNPDNSGYENRTYGKMLEEVKGDCTLYKHVAKDSYKCFGTAGNFSTMATNEYAPAESDKYFCKGTPYGCRLYERVEFQGS